jgi:hypothetical protein
MSLALVIPSCKSAYCPAYGGSVDNSHKKKKHKKKKRQEGLFQKKQIFQ